jgi:DNA (cytosine-5)-methyltransferase 1
MLRVVSEARPAWVLGENVAGIITMELDRVLSDLEGIGYAVWPLVIPAVAVDARHRRDRVWIVGHATSARCTGGQDPSAGSSDARENRGGSDQPERAGEAVAHPDQGGIRRPGTPGDAGHASQCGQDVANTNGTRSQGRYSGELQECPGEWIAGPGDSHCVWPGEADWFAQSGMGRVADGIPHRVHRLRGLGNAIVPQVAYEILRALPLTPDETVRH